MRHLQQQFVPVRVHKRIQEVAELATSADIPDRLGGQPGIRASESAANAGRAFGSILPPLLHLLELSPPVDSGCIQYGAGTAAGRIVILIPQSASGRSTNPCAGADPDHDHYPRCCLASPGGQCNLVGEPLRHRRLPARVEERCPALAARPAEGRQQLKNSL